MKTTSARRIAGAAGMLAALLALAACSTIGSPLEAIGAKVPPPDEFQVMTHKPLQMPGTLDLPEPRPGAASPLDPNPQQDAMVALLGTTGSPAVTGAAPSSGEQVLLSSANAAATSSAIRVQLEEDKIAEKTSKPYEPPSLGELLGLTASGSEKLDEKELIDPLAESQRLQREGLPAPVDPNAAAPEGEEAKRESVTSYYPATGRPQNKIVHEGTGPAN